MSMDCPLEVVLCGCNVGGIVEVGADVLGKGLGIAVVIEPTLCRGAKGCAMLVATISLALMVDIWFCG